jgi:diguanylate cyclase (GGDEF)-like protein
MKMKVNNIRHIPIMDGEALVGIVSLRDLTQSYQYKIESDLLIARKEIQELQGLAKGTDNEKIKSLIAQIRNLEELSLTDFLTGLYNARYFQIRLEEEIARAERYHSRFSLIFGDIDLFKLINDRFGHKYGDEVLKQIARILIESVGGIRIISRLRKSDIVARYGGEEFVIILPETSKKEAVKAAERIRKSLEVYPFKYSNEDIKITMSFGVAEYLEDAKDDADLILKADQAMYKAKNNGRNKVEAYSEA